MLSAKKPRMGFGATAVSSTRTNVREIPLCACCPAVCLRNELSGSLPQSNPSRSWDGDSNSILFTHRAFERPYRRLEPLVGLGRIIEQGEHLLRVLLRKPDHRLAFDHALRFHVGCLHDELIDRCAQKLRRLLQRV